MLDGDLLTNQVEQVLLDLGAQQATGCLTVLDAAAEEAEVYLKEGLVYSVFVPGRRPLLGFRLVSSGDLAPEALAEALEAQRTELQGWRLGELLVNLGYVDRDVVESFVSEQLVDMLGDLLGWQVDTWRFRKNKKARQDVAPPIEVPVVLNQVRDRRARWERLAHEIGGPEAVPTLSTQEATNDDIVLGSGEWAMLCKIDGDRSIADLAIDCGYTVFEAAEIVATLVSAGLVDVENDLEHDPLVDVADHQVSAGSGWDDLPEPTPEELAASVAQVTAALAGMYGETPSAQDTVPAPADAPAPPDAAAPAGWQDHLAWVEGQRRQAEGEAMAARVEAEQLAEQARIEREQKAAERERRRLEAEEVARAVEEARQAELARITEERSKEQAKKERKERKAVEATAWDEHTAWLVAQRSAVEDQAWQDHRAWLTEQRAAAEGPATRSTQPDSARNAPLSRTRRGRRTTPGWRTSAPAPRRTPGGSRHSG